MAPSFFWLYYPYLTLNEILLTTQSYFSSTGSDTAKKEPTVTPKPFQSRFLNRQQNEKPVPTKEEEEETESTSESETDSEEESDEDKRKADAKEMDKTDIGSVSLIHMHRVKLLKFFQIV